MVQKSTPRVAARVGLGLMIQILHERSECGPSNLVVLVQTYGYSVVNSANDFTTLEI